MQKQLFYSEQLPNEFQSDDAPAFIGTQVDLPHENDFSVLHYHRRYEVGICDIGEGVFLANDKIYYLSGGDMIFIAPGIHHYSHTLTVDTSCLCRFIYIEESNIYRLLCFLLKDDKNAVADILKTAEQYIPAIIHANKHPSLCRILLSIVDICKADQPYLTELENLKLAQFLIEAHNEFFIAQADDEKQVASPNDDKMVEDVAEYLSVHYNKNDTIASLAQRYHLSESRFSKRFIKVFGISPIAYRIKLRTKVAAELLEHTDLSIQFIASRVGYTDTSEFYKAFNKHYGMSPSAYRKARVQNTEQN